jgi:hypothetical protein
VTEGTASFASHVTPLLAIPLAAAAIVLARAICVGI